MKETGNVGNSVEEDTENRKTEGENVYDPGGTIGSY